MERMMRDRIVYGIGCSKSLHSFEKDAFVACGRIKRHELFGAINWNTKVPEDGVGDIASANVFQGVFTLFAKKAFRELMQLGTFNRPHSSTGGPSIEQSFVVDNLNGRSHIASQSFHSSDGSECRVTNQDVQIEPAKSIPQTLDEFRFATAETSVIKHFLDFRLFNFGLVLLYADNSSKTIVNTMVFLEIAASMHEVTSEGMLVPLIMGMFLTVVVLEVLDAKP